MAKKGLILIVMVLLFSCSISVLSAQPTLLGLQGKLTDLSDNTFTGSEDIRVNVSTTESCVNNVFYTDYFNNNITRGVFDLMLGIHSDLNLNYNQDYYSCISLDADVFGPFRFRGGQGQIQSGSLNQTGLSTFNSTYDQWSFNQTNTSINWINNQNFIRNNTDANFSTLGMEEANFNGTSLKCSVTGCYLGGNKTDAKYYTYGTTPNSLIIQGDLAIRGRSITEDIGRVRFCRILGSTCVADFGYNSGTGELYFSANTKTFVLYNGAGSTQKFSVSPTGVTNITSDVWAEGSRNITYELDSINTSLSSIGFTNGSDIEVGYLNVSGSFIVTNDSGAETLIRINGTDGRTIFGGNGIMKAGASGLSASKVNIIEETSTQPLSLFGYSSTTGHNSITSYASRGTIASPLTLDASSNAGSFTYYGWNNNKSKWNEVAEFKAYVESLQTDDDQQGAFKFRLGINDGASDIFKVGYSTSWLASNLGVGTTTEPTETLYVNGNERIIRNLTVQGNTSFTDRVSINGTLNVTKNFNVGDNAFGVNTDSEQCWVGGNTRNYTFTVAGAGASIHADSTNNAYIIFERGASSNEAVLIFANAGTLQWYQGSPADSKDDWVMGAGSFSPQYLRASRGGGLVIGEGYPEDDGNIFLTVTNSTNITRDLFVEGRNITSELDAGLTDSSSYWLCTSADCSSTCQTNIVNGKIIGCS